MGIKITKGWLEDAGACDAQLELFAERYPEGVTLTEQVLLDAAEDFDLQWLAGELVSYSTRSIWFHPRERAATNEFTDNLPEPTTVVGSDGLSRLSPQYLEARKAVGRTYDIAIAKALWEALQHLDPLHDGKPGAE